MCCKYELMSSCSAMDIISSGNKRFYSCAVVECFALEESFDRVTVIERGELVSCTAPRVVNTRYNKSRSARAQSGSA